MRARQDIDGAVCEVDDVFDGNAATMVSMTVSMMLSVLVSMLLHR